MVVLQSGAKLNATVAQSVGCSEDASKRHLSGLVAVGKVRVQNLARSKKRLYALTN